LLFDVSLYPVLRRILTQFFPFRDYLDICSRQDFDSALKTGGSRLVTKSSI